MLDFKILLIQEVDVVRRRFHVYTVLIAWFSSANSFVQCKPSNGISKFLSAFHY
ncbi:hypothetical protein TorRG33x02_329530 [Trema orientale]|uniref:Uncharacterized protein n=1 Tax=Trema orientale TaxID=63057 RepID=A0A2P5B8G3_TREOI|nr:hypothetical protein TorRG33x02_329530 [Trema orientale]